MTKTASPLHYIFQAMGQCSTLPTDGENGSKATSTMNQNKHRPYNHGSNTSSAYGKKQSREEQRDSSYNDRVGEDDAYRHPETTDVVMSNGQSEHHASSRSSRGGQRHGDVDRMVNMVKHGANKFEPYMNDPNGHEAHANAGRSTSNRPTILTEEPYPSPPEGAVRMRCYRLNLDAPVVLSPTHDHLGPMPYEPPAHLLPNSPGNRRGEYSMHSANDAMMNLQVSNSGEESEKSSTEVAISTARIFRGITVDKNGVILSQNARASRSSRGRDKSKQGEKSRQAAKIDKAKDLVDEGRKENDGEKSNMVSLVIVGEYDDMKQLVRDGAKKLRDAEGQPDEALLALNRPRQSLQNAQYPPSGTSRKRVPSPHTSQTAAQSPARSRSRNGRMQPSIPQSAPPKLKGHPRDRPSVRRMNGADGSEDRAGRQSGEKCNDISLFGDGESDWGFNSIWNCGATGRNGTTSPNSKPISPVGNKKNGNNMSSRVRYEGRNETSTRFPRGSSKRDAPGGKDVVIM